MTAGQPLYPVLSSQTARPVRAPHIRSILERRLGEFIGGQYGKYNLSSFLFEGNTDEKPYVSLEKWSPEPGEKPTFEEAKRQKYTEAKKGDRFGPSW